MNKTDRIFSKLYRIFGTFTVVCFASYFIKLLISAEGTLPWIVTVGVTSAVTLPYIFRRQLRALLKKAYLPLKAFMSCGMIFYAVTFICLVGYIYLSPVADMTDLPPDTDRVYIVFGAKINKNGPTSTLVSRLEAAADAMKADPNAVCITSGGQGPDEHMAEGEAMRDYMISLGIDAQRIYAETQASNTVENIEYSLALIESLGLSDRDIICISSDTHIPRIQLLCNRADVDAQFIKAETPKKQYLFTTWVREYLSYAKMLILNR